MDWQIEPADQARWCDRSGGESGDCGHLVRLHLREKESSQRRG